MNKKKVIIVAASLMALVIAGGVATSVFAAEDSSLGIGKFFGKGHGQNFPEMTETQKAEIETEIDAVNAAIEAGDYNAWVAAVKAVNENCPTLEKINPDNFSRYVEARKLSDDAEAIFKELGIDGRGAMLGGGMGFNRSGMNGDHLGNFGRGGRGLGRMQNVNASNTDN